VADRCSGVRIDCTPTLVTMITATAIVHRRVRPALPLPPDELRAPCACPASAPSPMATSAATPCPTIVPPRLSGPASPRGVTTPDSDDPG